MNRSIEWRKNSDTRVRVGRRRIHKKTFELPNGKTGEWCTIDDNSHTVSVCAFTRDSKILCVEQFRPGPEKVLLGAPGGFVDPNETPQEAIAREMLEETGFEGNFYSLAVTPLDAYSGTVRHHYLALDCRKVAEPTFGPYECLRIEALDPQSLIAKVRTYDASDETTFLLGILELIKLGRIPIHIIGKV